MKSTKATNSKKTEAQVVSRPRWDRIYYLLVIFNVFVVSLGLYLSHRTMGVFTQSVAVNQVWTEQRKNFSKLGQLASAVNAPGNDIFDSRETEPESEKMRIALNAFNERMATVRRELLANESEAEAGPLLADLDAVDGAMAEMTAEAGMIFSLFKQNQSEMAERHMATMDRKTAKFNMALNHLGEHVGVIQKRLFDEDLAAAASLRRFEYMLAGLALLMVGAAAIYGHKLAKQMESDAREKERYTESLRNAEARTRNILETAADGIITFDEQGIIESFNTSAEKIFGHSEDEILRQPVSALFPASYTKHLSQSSGCDPLITSGLLRSGIRATELNGIKRDGGEFPLEISLSSWETSEGVFYSGIVRDVTERKTLENQLTHQALHDPLTKLANRVLFRNRVEHAIDRAGRKRAPVAVLFLDLDNFKSVNDSLGHAAGDELLVSFTERLQACLRPSDTPARLGGDEFAVLVEDIEHTEGSVFVAERIRDVLSAPFSINGTNIFVSTSIGIATTATAHESPEELLRNADVAMYMSKSNGKDRYTVFKTEMRDTLIKRVQLEADMRCGIDRSEFEVYYQPIVDLQSEQIMGMEALVRWNHPKHGLIPPLDFIPLAEETNLIVPLGKWIMEEACRQTREWQTQYEYGERLSITVNIGSRQFQEDSLLQTVETALAKSGLPPQSLILEITESTMLKNTEATLKKLTELKSISIRLAIDDFGTGYSSLSYLQRFPVDILKIDKSFIDKISQGKEGAAVARAIITMSGTLHLKTIAEGIENLGQQTELQNLGCELGQGLHFAKPLQSEDMSEFLHLASSGRNKNGQNAPVVQRNTPVESPVVICQS